MSFDAAEQRGFNRRTKRVDSDTRGASMSTTKLKATHSALPWSVGHDGPSRPIILTGSHGMLSVDRYDERGKWSSYDNEEADCEFIVRAVNSHADMLEALGRNMELLRLIRDKMPLAWESVIDLKPGTNSPSFLVDVWDANKAAIAKARGGAA